METSDQIHRIEDKVQQLLKEYDLVKKEAERLQKENAALSLELQSKTALLSTVQQQVDALKLTSTGLEEGSKKELEKRIDIYLKDIDKCLALLNS